MEAQSEVAKVWTNEKGQSGVIGLDGNLYRVRKITETEAMRLMGYTDDEIMRLKEPVGKNGKPVFSKSAIYRFAGNSVVVSVYKDILEVILDDMAKPAVRRKVTLDDWVEKSAPLAEPEMNTTPFT